MDSMKEAGVTFYLEGTSLDLSPGRGNKFIGRAKLTASVGDVDLWEEAIEHLNGLVLHRGKDFKTELIDLLQGKTAELEETVEKERTVLQGQLEQERTRAQHAEAAEVKVRQQNRLLEAKVSRLQDRLDQWERPGI